MDNTDLTTVDATETVESNFKTDIIKTVAFNAAATAGAAAGMALIYGAGFAIYGFVTSRAEKKAAKKAATEAAKAAE